MRSRASPPAAGSARPGASRGGGAAAVSAEIASTRSSERVRFRPKRADQRRLLLTARAVAANCKSRHASLAPGFLAEALRPGHGDFGPAARLCDLNQAVDDLGVLARRGQPSSHWKPGSPPSAFTGGSAWRPLSAHCSRCCSWAWCCGARMRVCRQFAARRIALSHVARRTAGVPFELLEECFDELLIASARSRCQPMIDGLAKLGYPRASRSKLCLVS
jgi:hypothetical protein